MDKPEAAAASRDGVHGQTDLPPEDIVTGTGSLEREITALYWDGYWNSNRERGESVSWCTLILTHEVFQSAAEPQKSPLMRAKLKNIYAKHNRFFFCFVINLR